MVPLYFLLPRNRRGAGCIPVSLRGESSALEHEHAGVRDGSVKAISTWLRGLVAARKLVSTRNLT